MANNYKTFWQLSYKRPQTTEATYSLSWERLLCLGFIAIILTVLSVLLIDGSVQAYIWDIHSKPWIRFFKWVSWFGKSEWELVPTVLIILSCWLFPFGKLTRRFKVFLVNLWQLALLVLAPVVATGLSIILLKLIIQRPRPLNKMAHNEFDFFPFDLTAGFSSMPSGHTATVVSGAIIVSVIVPWLRIPLLFGAAFIAFSRLAFMNHYFSDLVLGTAIAVAITVPYLQFFAARRVGIVQTKAGRLKLKPVWRTYLKRSKEQDPK